MLRKIKNRIKAYGTRKSLEAIDRALAIRELRAANMTKRGFDYQFTYEFAFLELAEELYFFKCSVYERIFGV